jgi:cold shock CspA family protein
MVIGRVTWFGNFNNQTGKTNDYGFISLLEKNDISEIYVHRKNIDRNIQDVLKDKKGEGVYLEFDIDTNDKGLQAINVNLITFVGVVKSFKHGIGYIQCEGLSGVRISPSQKLKADDVLHFALRYNSKFNRDEAIFLQKITRFTKDLNLINRCINSSNPKIFMNFIPQYAEELKSLSLEESLLSVAQKSSILEDNDLHKKFFGKLSEEYPYLFIVNLDLRKSLSKNDGLNLVNNYLESGDNEYRRYFIDKILTTLTTFNESQKSDYWQKLTYLQKSLQYRGYLWDLAPLPYQQQAIKNHYHSFFKLVADFHNSDYPYSNYIAQDWRSLYQLNEQEKQLIHRWDSSIIHNSFNAAKMISARGAEKLVINFYRNLGEQVEDISLHQITQASENWKLGDVMLNSQELLDVKNARTEVNSNVYSEFCVPTFKNNRGSDVKIVAVLSQYLKKDHILQTILKF